MTTQDRLLKWSQGRYFRSSNSDGSVDWLLKLPNKEPEIIRHYDDSFESDDAWEDMFGKASQEELIKFNKSFKPALESL